GPAHRRARGIELDDRWHIVCREFLEHGHLILRRQVSRNRDRLAAGSQTPGQFLGAEVLGNGRGEYTKLTAWQEVRGLSSIHWPRVEPVVRAERDVHRLLEIAVHVPEYQTERTILVLEPAVERR